MLSKTDFPGLGEGFALKPRYSIQNHTIPPGTRRTFRAGGGYLILLLTGGSCQAEMDGVRRLCAGADMFLLKPHMSQTLGADGLREPCTLAALRVAPETLALYSDENCDLAEKYSFVPYGTALVHGEIGAVMLLKNLVTRLASLKDEELQLGLSIYENNLLSTFLVVFLRVCAQSDRARRRRHNRDLLADEVFLFIRAHPDEDLSLARLEKEFYVSGAHISRTFRQAAGVGLHAYITKVRIDLSKKYILQGCPVQEVFARCGFGSYNHFFKAFKKECGMTPREYFRQMSDILYTPPDACAAAPQ